MAGEARNLTENNVRVKIDNVRKVFNTRNGEMVALNGVSLDIHDNEFICVVGPSGCGKSTLLNIIAGLTEPTSGKVYCDGKEVTGTGTERGVVFQQYALFPWLTVKKNVMFALEMRGVKGKEAEEEALKYLAMVDLVKFADHYPKELSGGMKQRVAIARAYAANPEVLLMDEPFGALDPMTRTVLQEEVKKLQRKLNKTIIFVTHDMEEAISLADVIIFMDKGEIAQIASPEEMLRNPANDLIRSFLGKHIHDNNETLTISSFLRTNIFKVGADRGILECTELMALHGVDTLLVTDSDDRYLGTVSIEEINEHSQEKLDSIAPLVRRVMPEASITDEAKACFDKLLVKGGNYVVVLNPDQTIAGIVTRSSMARALASAVWGD